MSQTVGKITVVMVAKITKEEWTTDMRERQGINGMQRERAKGIQE